MNNYQNRYNQTQYSSTPAYTPANTGWSTRGRHEAADENPFDLTDISAEEEDDSLDWHAVIHDDSLPYVLLEEGNYDFTVAAIEQGQYPGSATRRPCIKAMVTLRVETPRGPAFIRRDFFLRKKLMYLLTEFFRCIGMMKRGDELPMNWEGAVGREGRGHFRPEQYTNAYGETRDKNTVTAFYDPEDKRH